MSTSLSIQRQNGNVPKTLQGEDHISGLVVYLPSTAIPAGFKSERVQGVSTIDKAEELGIVEYTETEKDGKTVKAPASWWSRMLHYQLSEIFRLNPAISLYVGIFDKPDATYNFTELKTVQNFASGRIRQMAVWCGDKTLEAADLTKLQGVADAMAAECGELSILYAPKVATIKQIATDLAGENKSRVSVVIGQDGSTEVADLYKDKENGTKASVSGLGVVLGLLSRAKVHQSIAWVREFPTGVSVPAFGDGTLVRDIDRTLLETLDSTARYLFFVPKEGQAGSYMNDSHTMDSAISDYAAIESVRTMDKAVRGIRTYLIPELGGNVYVDASTGKLASYTVSHLETVASHALEDMERAGELSGYKVEIDPEQDVASTGTVEIVIKNVASPVMRHITVKIGFAKSV